MVKEWTPGSGIKLGATPATARTTAADLPYMDEYYPEMSDGRLHLAVPGQRHSDLDHFIPRPDRADKARQQRPVMTAYDPATRRCASSRGTARTRRSRTTASEGGFDVLRQGLAIETLGGTRTSQRRHPWKPAWTAPCDRRSGRLVPTQGKDFGANGKWYNFDIAEAKKLPLPPATPDLNTEMTVTYGYNAGILKKMRHHGAVRWRP